MSPNVQPDRPKWTVFYNISSHENDRWVGTGWEFFSEQYEAEKCFCRQMDLGNVPTLRAFHESDRQHMGAVHR